MTVDPEAAGSGAGRYLVCSRKDGIGARLCNLLWTWRLARHAGLRTLCFWPPMDPYYGEHNGAGDLLDLFTLATGPLADELKIVDGRPVDFVHPEPVRLELLERIDPGVYAVTPDPNPGKRAPLVPVIETGMGPLLLPGEDAAQAVAEARALFAQLPILQRVRQGLKHVDRTLGLKNMIAVHVRGGDIIEILRGACEAFTPEAQAPGSVLDRYTEHFFRGCAPPPSYVRLVRPLVKQGYRILFFSDTPGAAHPFEKRFASQLVMADALAPPRLTGLQRALFEILLMSRCHAIVGSKSMFANLASLIGGPPLIDARRSATAEEFLRAYKRAVNFNHLAPETRAGVSQVLVRNLAQNRLLDFWGTRGEDVLRLLEAA